MLEQTLGRLRKESEERRGVRFERVFDYTADELWRAWTDPDQLRGWLGDVELDLRVGGSIVIRFGDDEAQITHGVIRAVEPPRLLEYEWNFPGESESVLRVELVPRDHGTLLILDHRQLGRDAATGYAAGWHSHLDALDASLADGMLDWDERFTELLPDYREQAASL